MILKIIKQALLVISQNTIETLARDERTIPIAYHYYLNKVLDLSETAFFILRKKNEQLSFLHTFHHTVMVLNIYLQFQLPPGK